jgi:flagellar motor switch protein FliM
MAGEAELVLDELRGLSEGVVIKLDRRLDQPLSVRLTGDGVVCTGHLGSNGSQRAVQVIAKN